MKLPILLSLAAMFCLSVAARCTGTARYKLTITNQATKRRFPALPRDNIHFSPLVGFTHAGRFSAFILYGYSTAGVRQVAETGATSQILRELRTATSDGFVRDTKTNNRLLFGDRSYSVVLEASCRHRFIGAITMVAPSPDWFVAVSRRNVVGKNGRFIKRASGMLRVYDAGTDSGKRLTSRNKITNPRQNIAPLWGEPFRGGVVGRYTLEKV